MRPREHPSRTWPVLRRLLSRTLLCLLAIPAAASDEQQAGEPDQSKQRPAEARPGRTRRPPLSPYLIDTGPIRVRDQFPLSMGFLAFDPIGADSLDRGDWQLDVIATTTNTFATSDPLEELLDERPSRGELDRGFLEEFDAQDPGSGVFVVDGELVRTAVALRRGVGRGVQLEMTVPVLNYTGGFLDGVIETFHDVYGFADAGRKGIGKNGFLVALRSPTGELVIDEDPGPVLGDIALGAKIRLFASASDAVHLALDTVVELPTGSTSRLSSNGSADFGARLVGSHTLGRLRLHGSAGLLALGEWEEAGIASQLLPSGMLALEVSLGRRSSGLLQLTASRTPFSDLRLPELSETTIQATAGFKRVVLGRNVLFVALTENLQNFDNSADVGLHLGFTRVY